jgi:hypothetical protein
MAGHKAVMTSQMYRQQRKLSAIHGNDKAAKITDLSLPEKSLSQRERWGEMLQTYCDYFIRY